MEDSQISYGDVLDPEARQVRHYTHMRHVRGNTSLYILPSKPSV
jgi:hypothetical protein